MTGFDGFAVIGEPDFSGTLVDCSSKNFFKFDTLDICKEDAQIYHSDVLNKHYINLVNLCAKNKRRIVFGPDVCLFIV